MLSPALPAFSARLPAARRARWPGRFPFFSVAPSFCPDGFGADGGGDEGSASPPPAPPRSPRWRSASM
eukprot:15469331-Alexandrium_andersonii.AAC.1